MKIKSLTIEEFLAYQDTILNMLVESYLVNFDITEEYSRSLSNEKINAIPNYMDQNNAKIIGAFESGILVGFLWLYKHMVFGKERFHINQIIVAKQSRGKGLGKLLMKKAEEIAVQEGIKTIDLSVSETNLEAVNMYSSSGFTTERRYMRKVL